VETIVGAVVGTLGVALVTGLLAFARERLQKADEFMANQRDEIKWYREKLLPVLEKQQEVLEELRKDVLRSRVRNGNGG
jgi:hypothetical protein